MNLIRFLFQIVVGASAAVGFVVFLFGNAVLLKLGVLSPDAAQIIEASRWSWLALGGLFFLLTFYRKPRGRPGFIVPIAVVVVGLGTVIGGAQWFPIQQTAPADAPEFAEANAAGLAPEDWVLGLVVGEEAKAYSWEMIQREVVINDVINGQPVLVTYCISCNSSLAYLAQSGNQTLRFGKVGVYRYETIFHDEQTGSWWTENGVSIAGELEGVELKQLPAALLSWADWQAMYPQTQVATIRGEER